MDNIDRKIIHLLQGNARTPLKYLASKVFLSSPAVSARIERLEKAGILTGYHASINHEALGYHITAFIHMALDPKQKPTFYPFVEACPNVLECNCVTGAHSMLMKYHGSRLIYRTAPEIWQHRDTDSILHTGSYQRGFDRHRYYRLFRGYVNLIQ